MMRSFLLAIALVCSFSVHTAVADDTSPTPTVVATDVAKLVVDGPETAKAGDLVIISVEKSDAASFKWIMIPATDNFLVIDGGKRAVFSSGVGGTYQFIVACAKGDTCDVIVQTVTVEGQPATPVDNLENRIIMWCKTIKSDTQRDDALQLAQSFSSMAILAESGQITSPKDLVTATFKSNQDALGTKLDLWSPFRDGLAKELKSLAEVGELTDTQSHVRVWKSIASALRNYAGTL